MSYYRTPEHRAMRAELIRRWKPWEKSPGQSRQRVRRGRRSEATRAGCGRRCERLPGCYGSRRSIWDERPGSAMSHDGGAGDLHRLVLCASSQSCFQACDWRTLPARKTAMLFFELDFLLLFLLPLVLVSVLLNLVRLKLALPWIASAASLVFLYAFSAISVHRCVFPDRQLLCSQAPADASVEKSSTDHGRSKPFGLGVLQILRLYRQEPPVRQRALDLEAGPALGNQLLHLSANRLRRRRLLTQDS